MEPWFENKFKKRNLRKYTRQRIDRNPFYNLTRKYSVTIWMIIINVIVFILISLLSIAFGEQVISYVALQANMFFAGQNLWTLITSVFMHGNLTHLFVNMITDQNSAQLVFPA